MIVDSDFLDHWRTQMLIDKLQDQCAPLYVLRLWGHCQNRKKTQFEPIPNPGIKALCRCPGDADLLVDSLIECQFITRHEDGTIEVNGWAEKNAKLLTAWGNGSKGGRPKKNQNETEPKPKRNPTGTESKPTGNPPETHAKPNGNRTETDKIRVDKSRLDESRGERGSTPVAPLPAVLNSPEFISALDRWKEYKGRAYKPRGLQSLISQAAKRAEQHGLAAVVNAFEIAMGNGWSGWNQDSSFAAQGSSQAYDRESVLEEADRIVEEALGGQ